MPRKPRFLPTKLTFHLGDRLGSGTVGVVFRAESSDLDHPVAVKLLHPAVADDENIVKRFEREVIVMEKLDHPHIVTHYGGGILDGQYFYAMQLLDHGTLKDRLRQHGPIPWPQAATFAAQIASALQHAHNHGIVHRDLKPSNLFFADGGGIVLGDFGIAFDRDDKDITEHGLTVGTYSYMSPEQICADGQITGKADLYSLGCVLYEMLTGKVPFEGANFAQVWDQHLHHDPPSAQALGIDCPQWLEDLVLSLLAKDPEARPFNARAVQGLIGHHLAKEFGDDFGDDFESHANQLATSLPPLTEAPEDAEPEFRTWAMWLVFCLTGLVILGAYWAQSR